MAMLELNNIEVCYGHIQALQGVSIKVDKGQLISIIGANGSGKTSLLNAISGVVKIKSGTIVFKNKILPSNPQLIVKEGIVQVPEGRRIFQGLRVKENLIIGGYLITSKKKLKKRVNDMFDLFPLLGERKNQQAGTLSGGEQQMLAICRGLMSEPELILLDEPSLGLAPVLIKKVYKFIENMKDMGMTVLLVEQNARISLELCDHAYVLRNGSIFLEGGGRDLLLNEDVRKAYLGEGVKGKSL